jgi:hypothetical protein
MWRDFVTGMREGWALFGRLAANPWVLLVSAIGGFLAALFL